MRILVVQGWYIVAYCLGIYILNLFLAFLQPKFDPSLDSTEDEGLEGGQSSLPTKADEEFRPFIRRLPEFKFWHSATRAVIISLFCTFFEIFNLPVFWPVLVMYWLILFSLTSECLLEETRRGRIPMLTQYLSAPPNSAHDQIPLRALLLWQSEVRRKVDNFKSVN